MTLPSRERARRRYRPEDVRVLFIAESPPAGGTFFYYANSKLYSATREAFEAALPAVRSETDFLDAFKHLGCYVEDLCREPVNHLDLRDPQRLRAREEGVTPRARRLRPWSPRFVVVAMKAIGGDAGAALARAGLNDVERRELPFPARHYHQYRDELADLVRSWRRRGILLPLQ